MTDPTNPQDQHEKLPLNYAKPSRPPSERGAWIGLIITLAICLAAAVVYLAVHG